MLCKGNPFLCSQFKTSFVSFCRAAPSREIERGNKFTSGIFSDMNPTSQVIPHGGERWDSNMVLGTFERREILPFHLEKWKWRCYIHLGQLISRSAQLNIVLAQHIFSSYIEVGGGRGIHWIVKSLVCLTHPEEEGFQHERNRRAPDGKSAPDSTCGEIICSISAVNTLQAEKKFFCPKFKAKWVFREMQEFKIVILVCFCF